VPRELRHRARLHVVREEVHRARAIGEEEHRVADPARRRVGRVLVRDLLDLVRLDVEQPIGVVIPPR
jgi:hypothetical protein